VRALAGETNGATVAVRFEIDDTGIGISSDTLPKLFQPFMQADDSASRQFGGTGLGLSISKRLAELMGGTIEVTSEPAVGSRFSFIARFGVAPNSSPVPRMIGVYALIAVEDETLAEILERYLASWAIPSASAQGPEDALNLLRAGDPRSSYIAIVQVPAEGSAEVVRALTTQGALDPSRIITIGADEALRQPVRASHLFDRIVAAVSGVPQASNEPNDPLDRSQPYDNPPAVLIAEDSAAMHEVLINQFEQLGIGVTIVSDGAQAVAAVENGHFDLVFMDCQMPNVDGFEATRFIRRAEKRGARHVSVIAMTANAFKEDRDACLAAGMDDYLSKPVRLRSIA
jgi:two-component system, sensor histidine kinase and response regulator